MVALVAGKAIKVRAGHQRQMGLAAGVKVYAGGIAVLTATGVARAGYTATGLKAIGYFETDADNTSGADNAVTVSVRRDVVQLVNSTSTDAITAADINNVCYIVDDQTVAKTNGTNTRSACGRIVDVDATGVWVDIGDAAMPTT